MAQQNMTLYIFPGACSLIPQMLLSHAGIQYKAIGVSYKALSNGEHFSVNPKGQVPVLVWNDEIITEVPAIAQTINHIAPEAGVLGGSPLEFIRVCEWMNFLSGSIHAQAWGPYVRPFRFTDESNAEAGVKRAAIAKLKEKFALVESKLPSSGWMVGRGFTAADAYLLAISRWVSGRAEFDLKTDCPKWASLVQRVESLAAVQEALAEEKRIAEELAD